MRLRTWALDNAPLPLQADAFLLIDRQADCEAKRILPRDLVASLIQSGQAILASGIATVTLTNPMIGTDPKIFLSYDGSTSPNGILFSVIVDSFHFIIDSGNVLDTNAVNWLIVP